MSPTPLELSRCIIAEIGGDASVDHSIVIKMAAEIDHAVYRVTGADNTNRLEAGLQAPIIQSMLVSLGEITGLSPEGVNQFVQRWHQHWRMPGNQVQPFPGAVAVVHELSRRGFRLGIMSNTEWDLQPILDRDGFDECFGVLIVSHEVGKQKPDPRIFEAGSLRAGVSPSQCALVGDTKDTDVDGAYRAGWLPVFLRRGATPQGELEGVLVVSQLDQLLRFFIASSPLSNAQL